jgi:hypothetical protein
MANHAGAGGRPPGRWSATSEEKAEFFRLVDEEKVSHQAAAQMLGFSAASGTKWFYDRRNRLRAEARERDGRTVRGKYNHPNMGGRGHGDIDTLTAPPKRLGDLGKTARAAVQETAEGFELFRSQHLNRRSKPWQRRAVADLLMAEAEGRAEGLRYYFIGNVFPGGGKSTTFTHDYAVWRITCARARGKVYRVQLGAESITQSRSYTERIRQTFENNIPLIAAFGRFKPLEPTLWMATSFTVDMPAGVVHDEKEPTVFAVSKESGFLGFRCELALWDDLVSKKTSRTLDGREQLYAWWIAEAESRVNPGGLCALVGTRVNRDDLFARLSRLRVIETDEADEHEVERPIYHVFTYPVHDTARCAETASLRRQDHKACLNDPEYYPWRTILRLRTANPVGFELTYQQNDVDLEDQLVQEIWLSGGVDAATGDLYPGCYDRDRTMWTAPPPHALADYRAAIVVDPSPTQYWAVEAWLWDKTNDVDYLLGLERRQMQVGDLLDMKPGTLEYQGMLESFLLKLRDINVSCYYVIIEDNAAQRFMLQYGFIKDWARSRGVTIRGHGTTHDKLGDEHYGIETLGPRYRAGRVNLPMANPASRERTGHLTREAMTFPEGTTDDCLKAQWFFHYNRDSLSKRKHQRRYYSSDSELSPRLVAVRHGKAAW